MKRLILLLDVMLCVVICNGLGWWMATAGGAVFGEGAWGDIAFCCTAVGLGAGIGFHVYATGATP